MNVKEDSSLVIIRKASAVQKGISDEIERRMSNSLYSAAYYGGRLLGHFDFPFRRRIREIGGNTWVDIDEISQNRLEEIAKGKKPVIVASNHRAVDQNLYPSGFMRRVMSVDSFILRSIFQEYGVTLNVLAEYNNEKYYGESWRRGIKRETLNYVRKGLYSELGYIPVHATHSKEMENGQEVSVSRATYPIAVMRSIRESVAKGHALGFFTYYGDTDSFFPVKLRPGAVFYAAKLGIDVVPLFIKNARHLNPDFTYPPDHVVVRVGQPFKTNPLSQIRRERDMQIEEATQFLHGKLIDLRRDAFAAQP